MTNVVTLTPTTTHERRYGTVEAVRAELTKLRTLRSTSWTLVAMLLSSELVTVLVTLHTVNRNNRDFQGFDPTNQSLAGIAIGLLVIGVLGVLSITGEHGTGTIRSSLAATPRRGMFVGAKIITVGAVGLVAGELLAFTCFFTGQGILSGGAPSTTIGHPGVLRALLLSGAYLALLALFGLGLGLIIRHTAGAIATFVGFTLLLPILLQPLSNSLARFTPEAILANSVATVVPQQGQLSALTGFVMMSLYCVVALALGAALLVRRDA